jgi:hypothetical protein
MRGLKPTTYVRKPNPVEAVLWDGSEELATQIIGWIQTKGFKAKLVDSYGRAGIQFETGGAWNDDGYDTAYKDWYVIWRPDYEAFDALGQPGFEVLYQEAGCVTRSHG